MWAHQFSRITRVICCGRYQSGPLPVYRYRVAIKATTAAKSGVILKTVVNIVLYAGGKIFGLDVTLST